MLEKFCLVSSKESISHNKISILAIFEVIFSMYIYWYFIPIYLNTYYHIIFSIVIPFFLLRSDESEKQALELFHCSFDYKKQSLPKTILVLFAVGIFLFLIYCLTKYLSLHLLTSYEGFSLFWRSIFVGLGLGVVAIGGVVGVIQGVAGIGALGIGVMGVVGIGIVGIAEELGAGGTIGVVAGLGAVVMGLGAGIVGVVGGLGVGVGGAMMTLILSVLIKIIIGIKYLLKGIKNIPLNWKTINFYKDINYTPEILIGINNFDGLDMFKLGFKVKGKNIEDTVTNLIMKILYIPAIMYRISLKSATLIYLIFFMMIPYFVNTKLENKYMADRLQNMFWIFISVCIIFISIGSNIFDIKYLSVISDLIHRHYLFKNIIYLFLSYAVCTLILYPFGVYLKEEELLIKRYVVNFIRYIQISSLIIAIFLSILYIQNELYPTKSISNFLDYIEATFFKSLEEVRRIIEKTIVS